ncbi:DNA methyltransferase [Micrococcus sp. IITD107]|uniref:DNA methyltransferase n=1 Tax=Micrococcus sp. IITD107 TaxID=3342790 RepID=UPI0035B71862
MTSYESIVVVEDWISEHYFTDDGRGVTFQNEVKKLRTQWDADAKDGHSTPVTRFSHDRLALQTAMAEISADAQAGQDVAARAAEAYAHLRTVLGLHGTMQEITLERGQQDLTVSAVPLGGSAEVLWLDAAPVTGTDAGLDQTVLYGTNTVDGTPRPDQPVSKLLSELYLAEPKPRYVVVAAGGILYLTERERWPEGRYLAVDAQLIAERNETRKGGEVDRLLAMVGRNSLVPTEDGTLWWDERLAESHEHAVGVSRDLRDGIRESIEIIANDVLRRRTARGLSNSDVDGQALARQSLRFLYRILFLLYAEASPELGVLPKGAGEYDAGYGLDRLRELLQVDLTSSAAERGTHLYESLALLFQLVNGDHASQQSPADQPTGEAAGAEDEQLLEADSGLHFESLEADLFHPSRTALIDEVGLGNGELQRVLERLLLSKPGSSGQRGFISYANLGINQLGAVYEGLMSYTGFIAETDLREVAKNGDGSKGSWVVPVERAQDIDPRHFVTRIDEETGLPEPVIHPKGGFVFRLAGRERQQSASYYTPEVLTRFVVSQALEELLDEDTPADRVLELSVCEPALGSGAFAIEAVRQLADEYLTRKQTELDRQIPAEEYAQELQRVKAQIALHQVHGVDLNATAVELAEVSLWLDTMQPGLHAPWFGLRLKRGNSLVGARRATYSTYAVDKKKYLSEEPEAHPLTGLAEAIEHDGDDPAPAGRIHHFLLPGEGWGAAADAKEVKDLAADEQKKLKSWAKSTRNALNNRQKTRLLALSQRVETLWKIVLRRLQIAEQQAKRFVDYFPHERQPESTVVTRSEIEASLADPDGAYRRLKRVMDAWTALWYWPLTERETNPPTVDEWIDGLEAMLGKPGKSSRTAGQQSLLSTANWQDLNAAEELDLDFAGALRHDAIANEVDFAWLGVCDDVAAEQGFFHWELEFAPVFARGGFDLQVGNPPWVRPDWDERAVYAEFDPWWQVHERTTQLAQQDRRKKALASPEHREFMNTTAAEITAFRAILTSRPVYPVVSSLRPDLYRGFMERTWKNSAPRGIVSLIHPESHFTEPSAKQLRAATYRRLRRHWQFINSLMLFEISDKHTYGVNIYGDVADSPSFLMAASLYHPETVERSFDHDGGGLPPGLKDDEGNWDARPHAARIIHVDGESLSTWRDILEPPGSSSLETRMVYAISQPIMSVLEKMAAMPRLRRFPLQTSSGWNETNDRKKGYFDVGSTINRSWNDVILQGPHFSVANPFSKQPNESMLHNQDTVAIDLEELPENFIPRTSYQPAVDRDVYDAGDVIWEIKGKRVRSRSVYRVFVRNMLPLRNERTLFAALQPPGAAHVHAVNSLRIKDFGSISKTEDSDEFGLVLLGGYLSSILLDFWIRLSAASTFSSDLKAALPFAPGKDVRIDSAIVQRTMRLQALSNAYGDLCASVLNRNWDWNFPARRDRERLQTQIEIDVLVAMSLGLSAEDLCQIYRTQFSVMFGYDRRDLYDTNGRKVPGEMNKLYRTVGGEVMTLEDRTWTHPQSEVEYVFEFPFRGFDREEDMCAAYAKFSAQLEEHGRILEDDEEMASVTAGA